LDEKQEITVVLADDHAIVREGIAALCVYLGLRVVGQCGDGASAVEMVLNLKPDIAILDSHMPGMTLVEIIRKLRAAGSTSKLMILSVCSEEDTVREAVRAGADAFLLKDDPPQHLLQAIAFVREGGIWISPRVGGAGVLARDEKRPAEDPLELLSPREREVFGHLVNGRRAKDIADLLEISPKTVDTYRASLMRKLNVPDLVALVKFAMERGLTKTNSDDTRRRPAGGGLAGGPRVTAGGGRPRLPRRPRRTAAAAPPKDPPS